MRLDREQLLLALRRRPPVLPPLHLCKCPPCCGCTNCCCCEEEIIYMDGDLKPMSNLVMEMR